MSPAPFSVVFVGAGEVRSARKRERETRFASPDVDVDRMTPARSTLVRRKDLGTTRNALRSNVVRGPVHAREECADLHPL